MSLKEIEVYEKELGIHVGPNGDRYKHPNTFLFSDPSKASPKPREIYLDWLKQEAKNTEEQYNL